MLGVGFVTVIVAEAIVGQEILTGLYVVCLSDRHLGGVCGLVLLLCAEQLVLVCDLVAHVLGTLALAHALRGHHTPITKWVPCMLQHAFLRDRMGMLSKEYTAFTLGCHSPVTPTAHRGMLKLKLFTDWTGHDQQNERMEYAAALTVPSASLKEPPSPPTASSSEASAVQKPSCMSPTKSEAAT